MQWSPARLEKQIQASQNSYRTVALCCVTLLVKHLILRQSINQVLVSRINDTPKKSWLLVVVWLRRKTVCPWKSCVIPAWALLMHRSILFIIYSLANGLLFGGNYICKTRHIYSTFLCCKLTLTVLASVWNLSLSLFLEKLNIFIPLFLCCKVTLTVLPAETKFMSIMCAVCLPAASLFSFYVAPPSMRVCLSDSFFYTSIYILEKKIMHKQLAIGTLVLITGVYMISFSGCAVSIRRRN